MSAQTRFFPAYIAFRRNSGIKSGLNVASIPSRGYYFKFFGLVTIQSVALSCEIQHAISLKLDGMWKTTCFSTEFLLPTLLCWIKNQPQCKIKDLLMTKWKWFLLLLEEIYLTHYYGFIVQMPIALLGKEPSPRKYRLKRSLWYVYTTLLSGVC